MVPPRFLNGTGTRPSITLAVRLVVFIAEAYFASIFYVSALSWVSWLSMAGWSIGLAFGIVVIVWRTKSVREAVSFQSLAFLAASALIWILVAQLINRSIKHGLGGLFGVTIDDRIFYGSIVLGTVFLSVAHAKLLGTSWTRTLIAIPGTLGFWLFVTLNFLRDPIHSLSGPVWQAAYLLFMFGSKPIFAGATVIMTALAISPGPCGENASPDQRIRGCTAVIQLGKYTNLAFAFYNRGSAFYDKGEYDHAIADYNQAILLGPNDPFHAFRFISRGNAYGAKGEYDRAIADYGQAIRLNPKEAISAYYNRGDAYFYEGDFTAAAADLLRANNLKADAYAMLWLFLARSRAGQDGAAELSANAAQLRARDWPYPVIDFYLGRRTLDEIRAAATTSGQRCEVTFYSGEWHLLRGEKATARTMLQNAVDTCPKNFIEYAGALAELKRLNP